MLPSEVCDFVANNGFDTPEYAGTTFSACSDQLRNSRQHHLTRSPALKPCPHYHKQFLKIEVLSWVMTPCSPVSVTRSS